jgi:hypothetical protein
MSPGNSFPTIRRRCSRRAERTASHVSRLRRKRWPRRRATQSDTAAIISSTPIAA